MKVHLEYLYHYNCDRCHKWWSVADIKPEIGNTVYCPHCGSANSIEGIESHQLAKFSEPKLTISSLNPASDADSIYSELSKHSSKAQGM